MPRDSQRSKVYAAEQATRVRHDEPIGSEHFDVKFRAELCNLYVNGVMKRKYVQRKYPKAAAQGKVYVDISYGAYAFARAVGGHTIKLPSAGKWAFTELVLLHELAHIIEHRENGSKYGWHDWPFVAIFLDLVRNVMGKEAHDHLKAEFKRRRVRFKPKVKRQLTEAQREAARERMAKARAVREEKLAFKRKVVQAFEPTKGFIRADAGKVLGVPVDKHPKGMSANELSYLKARIERYERDRMREAQQVTMTPEEQRREDFRYRTMLEFGLPRPHSFITVTGTI